jgi:hypothetical protein
MANSTTKSTAARPGPTTSRIVSGVAMDATAPAILAHSSPLSAAEQQELFRLRTIRKRGQMLTMGECDWLVETLERLTR